MLENNVMNYGDYEATKAYARHDDDGNVVDWNHDAEGADTRTEILQEYPQAHWFMNQPVNYYLEDGLPPGNEISGWFASYGADSETPVIVDPLSDGIAARLAILLKFLSSTDYIIVSNDGQTRIGEPSSIALPCNEDAAEVFRLFGAS
jgi:hypothetical protein